MARPSEQWSDNSAHADGKTDANLANDSLHLGGIPADDWATKNFVRQYYDNKEAILKEYIDTQDAAKLLEAKNYVDTAIRNQDFSNFAELQDLQTLSYTLNTKIEQYKSECESNLNTQIGAVVADVNANFTNVNQAINRLNQVDQQLFQSVSNGKQKVAAAITDQGVNTASDASFDIMASNIRQIESGGGEYDENFVNTADGTATADEIFLGKIAYVKGQKLYGTFINYDTSYPTYGTDTSGGNVTASDIPYGKVAYSGGQAIVGTGSQSAGVQEVYGADPDNYDLVIGNVGLTTYEDTDDEVTKRYCMEFSKNGNFCVSGVKLNGATDDTEFYIESHPVTNDGLVIHASSGVSGSIDYKKYRYSKYELGLDDDETLQEIRLGSAGLFGSASTCLLMIRTNKYLHFYSYHLTDNGAIGREYNAERYMVENYKYNYINDWSTNINYEWKGSIFSNTNPCKLFAMGNKYTGALIIYTLSLMPKDSSSLQISISKTQKYSTIQESSSFRVSHDKLHITENDRYITSGDNNDGRQYAITLDEYLDYESSSEYKNIALETYGLVLFFSTGAYNNKTSLSYDGKTIYLGADVNMLISIIAVPTEDKIIALMGGNDQIGLTTNSLRVCVYNTDDILGASDGETVNPVRSFRLSNRKRSIMYQISSNYNGSKVLIYNDVSDTNYSGAELWVLYTTENSQKLEGIRYNGQFFRAVSSGILSAEPGDVAAGKTFIGYDGTVQTGTYGSEVVT